MQLTTRQRILMIRLMEKLEKKPSYAKALIVQTTGVSKNRMIDTESKTFASAWVSFPVSEWR